jgi:hypothetical protein
MKFCALLAASLLLICCTAASLLLASNVNAQEPSRVHADGIQILLIADNPFSGRYSIDSTQKQDDGSPKTVHVDTNVARDRQGRIHREHRNVAPSDSEKESAIADVFILDPVAHTRTSCNVAARHCQVARYHGPSFLKPAPDGLLDPSAHFVTRKSLGSDIIDGFNVIGTIEKVAIRGGWPAEKWQTSTREFWYSPDLGINLSATTKDPIEGEVAIRIVDLSRSDPDPALFQIPSGFVVEVLHPPSIPSN